MMRNRDECCFQISVVLMSVCYTNLRFREFPRVSLSLSLITHYRKHAALEPAICSTDTSVKIKTKRPFRFSEAWNCEEERVFI